MPIKDALRVFKCDIGGKKFTMFEKSDGELVYFPENVMWPVHGKLELAMHFKSHKPNYEAWTAFNGWNVDEVIKKNFKVE